MDIVKITGLSRFFIFAVFLGAAILLAGCSDGGPKQIPVNQTNETNQTNNTSTQGTGNNETLTQANGTNWGYKNETQTTYFDSNLKVYVLPFEAADAILVSRSDFHMLYDTGREQDYAQLKSFLNRLGITELSAVVITTELPDHSGGFSQLVKDFKIDEVWKYKMDFTENRMADALREAQLNGAKVITPSYGMNFTREGVRITVLNPQKESFVSKTQDSIALRVELMDSCFLLFSESETSIEMKLKGMGANLKCDVLKGSTHGDATATDHLFLQSVEPEMIVFTTDGKDYPHKTTMERINIYNENSDKKITVLNTHEKGMVTFVCDGKSCRMNSDR